MTLPNSDQDSSQTSAPIRSHLNLDFATELVHQDIRSASQKLIDDEHRYQPIFTGTGQEYFKIWIVNLCLTLISLGIYSAWAKVRRLQYFDRNTQIAGACFNFHGNPLTILRGRIIAAVLLFLYHYVFGLSQGFALVFATFLLFSIPWMMRSALRFRLRNTSYRGLRFDFTGTLMAAYANYLPITLMFVLPALIAVLADEIWYSLIPSLLYLLWPWFHARMKRYQHANFAFGQKHASSTLSGGAFVWPYFLTGIYILLFTILAGILTGIIVAAHGINDVGEQSAMIKWLVPLVVMGVVTLLAYLVLGPYLQTRIWNEAWNHSLLDDIRFQSQLPLWAYTRLQSKNAILTLFSLGLYRPFAVVNSYQFRLSYIAILASEQSLITHSSTNDGENAAAESSAEFFGFDLSW
ncbi:YjgN family protein [Undibacterium fentianense]|uniref:DUF898 domain-containing protein n=1 Tax=Undibacterium fentianense TaxID=2828728 RepID=A0A941IFR1_9BURK|nr:YjgN family protein [Undibacterium fentianense]MBR7800986.1 DUF898 domain-containing protein [Undibacterium fentianense]